MSICHSVSPFHFSKHGGLVVAPSHGYGWEIAPLQAQLFSGLGPLFEDTLHVHSRTGRAPCLPLVAPMLAVVMRLGTAASAKGLAGPVNPKVDH